MRAPSCIALVCLHLLHVGIASILQEVAALRSATTELEQKSGKAAESHAKAEEGLRVELSQACCSDSFVLFAMAMGIASVCR